ncbi:MAG: dihydrofolate reductase family protein [Saprospiraceae bacterium]
MRILNSFTFITINGLYKGLLEDISWHGHGGGEEADFASKNAQSNHVLLFGRKTYDMMSAFWPTPMAAESMPEIAKGINSAEKIVFSRTLKVADWNNARIIGEDMIKKIKELKKTEGNDMTLLGSGSILSQLSDAGLIDQYDIMIDPVAIGQGAPIFQSIQNQLNLKLKSQRVFASGTILLQYVPRE